MKILLVYITFLLSTAVEITTTDGRKIECGEHPVFGSGPSDSCVGPIDPLNKPPSELETWFTEDTFNDLFPKANLGHGPSKCSPYSWESFRIAVRYFPHFGTEFVATNPQGVPLPTSYTKEETYRRDVASFISHAIQETGENSSAYYSNLPKEDADECFYRGGLFNWFESSPGCGYFPNGCHQPELGVNCNSRGRYETGGTNNDWYFPAQDDQCYFGRGAIQISYNYNYGRFSKWLNEQGVLHNGEPIDLLKNPNLVVTKQDPPLIFMASLWFYMTPQPPRPSMHDIIIGNWVAKPQDIANGMAGGILGPTSLIINNECGGEDAGPIGGAGESRRIKAFRFFAKYFKFHPGSQKSLSCNGFGGFITHEADVAIPLGTDVNWSTQWDTSKTCACAPAAYEGLFPYFQPGYYPQRWVDQNVKNKGLCEAELLKGWQAAALANAPCEGRTGASDPTDISSDCSSCISQGKNCYVAGWTEPCTLTDEATCLDLPSTSQWAQSSTWCEDTSCQNVSSDCENASWDICSSPWWREQCAKTCGDCVDIVATTKKTEMTKKAETTRKAETTQKAETTIKAETTGDDPISHTTIPGTTTNPEPITVSSTAEDTVNFCYFTNWARYRSGLTNPGMDLFEYGMDDSADLCTHIVYGFATIDEHTLDLKAYDPWADHPGGVEAQNELCPSQCTPSYVHDWNQSSQNPCQYPCAGNRKLRGYEGVNQGLKSKNPKLKSVISSGGWNFNDCEKKDNSNNGWFTCEIFSNIASSEANVRKHAKSVIDFCRRWGFDGYDIDWEYPVVAGHNRKDMSATPQDYDNYIRMLKILKEEFVAEAQRSGRPQLLLTAAVGTGLGTVVEAYNIPEMSKQLDFINLMSYDLHGYWEDFANFNAPLYATEEDIERYEYPLSVSWAVDYWLSHGAKAEQLTMGIGTYGRGFTLKNANQYHVGADSIGGSTPGITMPEEEGYLSYIEIVNLLQSGRAKRYWDDARKVPYIVYGDQWVGYDDKESLSHKLQFLKSRKLRGTMVWALDLDDFSGHYHNGEKFPLISQLRNTLKSWQPCCSGEPDVTLIPVDPIIQTTSMIPEDPIIQTTRDCTEEVCAVGMPNCGEGVTAVDTSKDGDCCPIYECQEVIGYWDWTWGEGSSGPVDSNLAISFSGWNTIAKAFEAGSVVTPGKTSFFSLGGGNHNGIFTQSVLDDIIANLQSVKDAGFAGVAYDIEECDAYLDFSAAFQKTKDLGLEVMVTISHSAPYGCPDKIKMTKYIIKDPNVDYLSPQLYTSGYETEPDFSADGVAWNEFARYKGKFVPSIVNTGHYSKVKSYFANLGIDCVGYVQWEQEGTRVVQTTSGPSNADCDRCIAEGKNCYVSGWSDPCSLTDEATCLNVPNTNQWATSSKWCGGTSVDHTTKAVDHTRKPADPVDVNKNGVVCVVRAEYINPDGSFVYNSLDEWCVTNCEHDQNWCEANYCECYEPTTTEPSTTAGTPSTTVASTTAAPDTTIPSTTVPSTTVPSTTAAPDTTIPSTTAPSTTVPSTTVPSTTVPSTTVPSTTVPSTTIPSTTAKPAKPINVNKNGVVCVVQAEYINPDGSFLYNGLDDWCVANCENHQSWCESTYCECYKPTTAAPKDYDTTTMKPADTTVKPADPVDGFATTDCMLCIESNVGGWCDQLNGKSWCGGQSACDSGIDRIQKMSKCPNFSSYATEDCQKCVDRNIGGWCENINGVGWCGGHGTCDQGIRVTDTRHCPGHEYYANADTFKNEEESVSIQSPTNNSLGNYPLYAVAFVGWMLFGCIAMYMYTQKKDGADGQIEVIVKSPVVLPSLPHGLPTENNLTKKERYALTE